MENGKPFIFIHPLSETLQKLLDEYKGKAEAENLEIFELENVAEVNQVLPTLGQSLTITSSPKKCAQILLMSKKIIKRNNLKIILLSPKQLPWKVQQKLTKIGLTECAVEPIPQRTLSYKVNLHLRAIKVDTNAKDDPTKTFSADGDNQFNNMDEQNVERGIKKDTAGMEGSDLYNRKKPKAIGAEGYFDDELIGEAAEGKDPKDDLTAMMNEGLILDMEMEDEGLPDLDAGAMPKREMPEYADEDPDALMNELMGMRDELGGNLQGDANFQEHIMKDFEGKGGFAEEDKSGNYKGEGKIAEQLNGLKGKSNFKEDEQDGNFEGKGKEADQLNDLKGKSNFKEDEQGGNFEGKGKEADQLNDLKAKSNFKEDEQGGNYEGEGKTADQLKDLAGKNNMGAEKQPGNLAGETKEGANEEPGNLAGKNNFKEEKKGNLEGDQKEGAEKKPGNLAGKTKEGAEQQAGNLDGKTQQAAERKKDYDGKGQKADEIEGFYGRKKEKADDASKQQDKEKVVALSLDTDKKKKETEDWQEGAKKGMSVKGEKADEFDSHWGRKKEKAAADETRDESLQDGTLSLDAGKEKKETEDRQEDAKKGMLGKGEKADQIDSHWGRKKENAEEAAEKAKNPEAESLDADKYKTKEKGYDFESDSGSKKDAPTMEAEDPKKKNEEEAEFESLLAKSGSEIKYAKPKDWGEQTIDYRKLNDEFGGITTDRKGEGGDDMQIKDGETPQPEKTKDGGGIETAETPPIEAKPKGLDDLVSVLELYLGNKSPAVILDNIAETVVEKGAEWSLFCKSDGNKLELSSYGGLDPIKASQKVSEHSSEWLNKGLPEWSDQKFQEEQNTFFFPYFDGVTPLGVFVAHFGQKISEEDSKSIEVLVEGARGVFLDSHIKVVEEKPKKEGVLGKLFGKKAG